MDENQAEIVEYLRTVPDCTVALLSGLGGGIPDVLVGYRGANFLFEIKNPKKPKADQELTDDQRTFHAEWKGQVNKVSNLLQIITIITGWPSDPGTPT